MKLVGEAVCCGQLPLHPHGGLMNWRRLAGSVCDNKTTSAPPIQIKTLLNKVHRLKSFVYHSVKMCGTGDKARLIAEIIPRANSRPVCSGCGIRRPGYDRMLPANLSSSRSGTSPSPSPTACAAWIARDAESKWRASHGRRASIPAVTPTAISSPPGLGA